MGFTSTNTCFLPPTPCSVDHMLNILLHALPIYPHIPESGVMPCSNMLLCARLQLKAIHHVVAPLRSATPAAQAKRGVEGFLNSKERQHTYMYHVCFWICSNCKRKKRSGQYTDRRHAFDLTHFIVFWCTEMFGAERLH